MNENEDAASKLNNVNQWMKSHISQAGNVDAENIGHCGSAAMTDVGLRNGITVTKPE